MPNPIVLKGLSQLTGLDMKEMMAEAMNAQNTLCASHDMIRLLVPDGVHEKFHIPAELTGNEYEDAMANASADGGCLYRMIQYLCAHDKGLDEVNKIKAKWKVG